MKAIKTIIESGIKAEKDSGQILGMLLVEGYKESEAKAALKEAGLTRTRSTFRAWLYEALESGPMDEAAFKKAIAAESKNVRKHESHYNEIRELLNRVWNKAS